MSTFKSAQRERPARSRGLHRGAVVGHSQRNVVPIFGVEVGFQRIAAGGLELGVVLNYAAQRLAGGLDWIDLRKRAVDASKYGRCCVSRDTPIAPLSTYDHIIRRGRAKIDPVFLTVPAHFNAEQFGDLADGEIIGLVLGNIHIDNDRWYPLPIGRFASFTGKDLILTEQRYPGLVVFHPAGSCKHAAHREATRSIAAMPATNDPYFFIMKPPLSVLYSEHLKLLLCKCRRRFFLYISYIFSVFAKETLSVMCKISS